MIAVFLTACSNSNKKREGEPRVLVFTKTEGFRHASIPEGVKAIQQLGDKEGFKVDTTSISSKFTEDTLKQYSAIIFINTTGDILDTRQQVEFERYIQAGGGYMGIHGSTDSEFNWPWYGKLMGAYFKNHPAIQEAKLNVHADKNFPITASLPNPWIRTDEWYNFTTLSEDVNVLISIDEESYKGGENGKNHPMVWYHEYDGGRAFYSALGHTPESYEDSDFLDLLKAGIDYVIGENRELDYKKASSLRVPEEDRFSKEILAEGLDEPTELTVLPNLDVLISERKGAIKYYNAKEKTISVVANLDVYYKALEAKVNVEFGLLGMQADPNFTANNWIYLFYSPPEKAVDRLSRFKFTNGDFDLASEQVIIEVETTREICCHTGGSIAFDSDGNLLVSTGDNSTPFNQTNPKTGKSSRINTHGFAPIDDRDGYEQYDARRSSGNSADLRGKILRIRVNEDGTYSIPEGNLFSKDEPKTRSEIYVMGTRNPYRISVDQKTNYLYWGDVGPDANNDSLATRGPMGYDEINQAKKAGNFGWPYVIGENYPYREYNYETGESGKAFDPKNLVNNSRNNTGLKSLPPAQPAFIEYPYAASKEFPILGNAGRTSMTGPVYYSDLFPKKERYPEYYDGKLFIYDWMRDWIMAVTMDKDGQLETIEPFMKNTKFQAISDMEIGPNGQLYTVEYGKGWYSKNEGAVLSVLSYNGGNRLPVVTFSSDKTAGAVPLKIRASAEGTYDPDGDKLTFVWDFGNGVRKETQTPTLDYTFEKSGVYSIFLTVIDEKGAKSQSQEVTVYAGNSRPEVTIDIAGNSTFYFPDKAVEYNIKVKDDEDGELKANDFQSRGYVKVDYLESHDQAASHTASLVENSNIDLGKAKMESLDCIACHKLDEKSVGPSYQEMAQRYKDDHKAINFLADKILKGGAGNWGDVPMSAHPDLALSDAEDIVTWILSLANEDVREASLPMSGSFIPSDKFQLTTQGTIVLSASYTDKGYDQIPSLTDAKRIVLLNPSLNLEDSETSTGISSKKLKGRQFKSVNAGNSWIKFSNISLQDVKSIKVKYGMSAADANGWKLELRLDSPEGKLIGEQVLANRKSAPESLEAVLNLKQSFEEKTLYDLYCVFSKTNSEERGSIAVKEIKLVD